MECMKNGIAAEGKISQRFFSESSLKFQAAVAVCPNASHILFQWGKLLVHRAMKAAKEFNSLDIEERKRIKEFFLQAEEKFSSAVEISRDFPEAHFRLGKCLFLHSQWEENDLRRENQLTRMTQELLVALQLHPPFLQEILPIAHFLRDSAKTWNTYLEEIIFNATRTLLEGTLRLVPQHEEILFSLALLFFQHAIRVDVQYPEVREQFLEESAQRFAEILSRNSEKVETVHTRFSSSLELLSFGYLATRKKELAIPKVLSYLTNITTLNLDYSLNLSDEILSIISHIPSLKILSLRYCYHISFSKCSHPSLEELSLEGSVCVGQMTHQNETSQMMGAAGRGSMDSAGNFLIDLPSLKSANLSFCPLISDPFLQLFCRNLSALESLTLNSLPLLSEISLEHLFNLKTIEAQNCRSLAKVLLPSSMVSINFSQSKMLSEETIHSLVKESVKTCLLETVLLDGCVALPEQSLKLLLSRGKNLIHLKLNECSVPSSSLKSLGKNSPNLRQLHLERVKASNPIASLLKSGATSLTQLNLSGLKGVPLTLSSFPSLRKLTVEGYGNPNNSSLLFVTSKNEILLEELCLSRCSVLVDPFLLPALPLIGKTLRVLDLSACILVGNELILQVTTHCLSLKELHLFGCYGLSDQSVKTISQCAQLEVLQLGGCKNISDSSITQVASHCLQLKHLDLSLTKVSDTSILVLSEHLRSLEILNLSKCKKITDAALLAIAQGLTNLVQLDLFFCEMITNRSLQILFQNAKKLKSLDISECSNISDEAFLVNLPSFETVNLMRNFKISDGTISQIAKFCPNLRTINLRSCVNVTEKAIEFLTKSCPKLKIINIKESNVSIATIKTLAIKYPHLKVHE